MMITNIALLIWACAADLGMGSAPPESIQNLLKMMRKLEELLFSTASSFDEYRETNTLRRRLEQLVVAMGLRWQTTRGEHCIDTAHFLVKNIFQAAVSNSRRRAGGRREQRVRRI